MIAPPGGAAAMYYTGPAEDFSRPGRTWYPTLGQDALPALGRGLDLLPRGRPRPSPADRAGALPRRLAEPLPAHARGHLGPRRRAGRSTRSGSWASSATSRIPRTSSACCARRRCARCASSSTSACTSSSRSRPHERYHPGETWTPELALPFVIERSKFPADFMASEVDRYLGLPGQAISYKVGERVWLEARDAARPVRGGAFDLKEFHRAALDLGPDGPRPARPGARPALSRSGMTSWSSGATRSGRRRCRSWRRRRWRAGIRRGHPHPDAVRPAAVGDARAPARRRSRTPVPGSPSSTDSCTALPGTDRPTRTSRRSTTASTSPTRPVPARSTWCTCAGSPTPIDRAGRRFRRARASAPRPKTCGSRSSSSPAPASPTSPPRPRSCGRPAPPNGSVLLDTWHFARGGGTLADLDADTAALVGALQISDRSPEQDREPYVPRRGRKLPGDGALPLVEIVATVLDAHPDLPSAPRCSATRSTNSASTGVPPHRRCDARAARCAQLTAIGRPTTASFASSIHSSCFPKAMS